MSRLTSDTIITSIIAMPTAKAFKHAFGCWLSANPNITGEISIHTLSSSKSPATTACFLSITPPRAYFSTQVLIKRYQAPSPPKTDSLRTDHYMRYTVYDKVPSNAHQRQKVQKINAAAWPVAIRAPCGA